MAIDCGLWLEASNGNSSILESKVSTVSLDGQNVQWIWCARTVCVGRNTDIQYPRSVNCE